MASLCLLEPRLDELIVLLPRPGDGAPSQGSEGCADSSDTPGAFLLAPIMVVCCPAGLSTVFVAVAGVVASPGGLLRWVWPQHFHGRGGGCPFAVMRLIQSLGYECLAVQLKGCSAPRWVPHCAWSARQGGTWGPSMLTMATGTAIQAWVPCSVRSDRRPLSTSRPSIDPPLSGRPCLPVLGRYLPPTSRSHI